MLKSVFFGALSQLVSLVLCRAFVLAFVLCFLASAKVHAVEMDYQMTKPRLLCLSCRVHDI
jgi:hypothetical protein